MVLFGRFLFGVGVGFVSPLANALILGLYEPKTASAYLGYSTLLMNFGGIIFQYLGGVLSGMGWNYTFWGHLPAIISLIMSFFLVEPDKPADTGEAAPKEKMSPFIWVTALVFFLFNLGNYPLMMYMSFVFMAKGAGDAVAAATALSIYTIAGCVAGAIFGKVFQAMGRFITPLGFAISAVGQFLILIGQNAVIMSCGTALIGFGFSLVMPSFFAYIGMNTPPSTVAFATSINMGLMNVSGFVCSYYLEYLVSKFSPASMTIDGVEYPVYIYTMFYWAIAISIICAVIFLVVNPMKKAQAGGPPPAA
jgi:MFS family permease